MREKIKQIFFAARKVLKKFLRALRFGKNTKKENLLVRKIRDRDWIGTSELLKEGVDPDSIFYHKSLGLYDLFSCQGATEFLLCLLSYKLDVNLRDRKKQLLFEVAINMRNKSMFDALLKHKPRKSLICSTGKSVIHFAAEHVYVSSSGKYLGIEFVKELLENGIIWKKEDFPKINKKKVEKILQDEVNGLEELSKYLVDLVK